MDVSVIIVNYNTKSLTIQCINSIYRFVSSVSYEIIVVDNGSSDDSIHAILQVHPKVKIITNQINLGFGKANNLAAEVAIGKYLFFLNSDTILFKNSILEFFKFNKENQHQLNIGVIGGVLLDEEKKETGSFGPLPSMLRVFASSLGLLPRFNGMRKTDLLLLKENKYFDVGYVMGADMFIDKLLFERVGGFDPAYFMYYEETDLQHRLNMAGFDNFIIANAEIIHLEGKSTNKNSNNNKRLMFTESMMRYLKKHNSRTLFFVFKSTFLLIRLPTIFIGGYKWREKISYLNKIAKS